MFARSVLHLLESNQRPPRRVHHRRDLRARVGVGLGRVAREKLQRVEHRAVDGDHRALGRIVNCRPHDALEQLVARLTDIVWQLLGAAVVERIAEATRLVTRGPPLAHGLHHEVVLAGKVHVQKPAVDVLRRLLDVLIGWEDGRHFLEEVLEDGQDCRGALIGRFGISDGGGGAPGAARHQQIAQLGRLLEQDCLHDVGRALVHPRLPVGDLLRDAQHALADRLVGHGGGGHRRQVRSRLL
eukprot:5212138-Pyramimonas_sp.AAC.1